jgi:hypothetical protein
MSSLGALELSRTRLANTPPRLLSDARKPADLLPIFCRHAPPSARCQSDGFFDGGAGDRTTGGSPGRPGVVEGHDLASASSSELPVSMKLVAGELEPVGWEEVRLRREVWDVDRLPASGRLRVRACELPVLLLGDAGVVAWE